jgi:hypothetical protein
MLEILGCSCLGTLILLGVLWPFLLAGAYAMHRLRKTLHQVDLNQLSDADRILWQSYDQQLQANNPLEKEQQAQIEAWPKKR